MKNESLFISILQSFFEEIPAFDNFLQRNIPRSLLAAFDG